jgi:seryl-tRNA synthetase
MQVAWRYICIPGGSMSQQNAQEDNNDKNASSEPGAGGQSGNTPEPGRKAPWSPENFDSDRAAKLLENLHAEKEKLSKRAEIAEKQLQEKLDAEKSEFQKATERAEAAEKALKAKESELIVAKISQKYSIPAEFLQGESEEEIENKAKAFAEWAQSNKSASDQVSSRPKPQLKDGTGVDADLADFDPKAIAENARKYT